MKTIKSIVLGVVPVEDNETMVLVNKTLSIEELGEAFADLTSVLLEKYPEAVDICTKLLEERS